MGDVGPGAAWWAVVISSVPSVGAGLFMFIKWWAERKDTSDGKRLTREQQEAAEIARDREKLNERTNGWIARIEAENERLAARNKELQANADDLERMLDQWRWYAWHVRGMMREARAMVAAQQRLTDPTGKLPAIVWTPEPDEPAMRKPGE
jgi:predicted RNase H-like nuclease (RuvC/YqgF family)